MNLNDLKGKTIKDITEDSGTSIEIEFTDGSKYSIKVEYAYDDNSSYPVLLHGEGKPDDIKNYYLW